MNEPVYDVAIIGGGIAGCQACALLAQKGLKTALIEAKSRPGGRILSQTYNDTPIELGAEYIHTTKGLIYSHLTAIGASHYRVQRKEITHSRAKGVRPCPFDDDQLLKKAFESIKASENDRSIYQALESIPPGQFNQKQFQQLINWIEAYHALEVKKGSFSFIQQDSEETLVKLNTTLSSLTQFLEEKIKHLNASLFLNCPIVKVDWKKEITIWAQAGRIIRAKKVVVTTPISTLKQNKIAFDPPLQKEKALSCFEMGVAERVTFVLKRSPFPHDFTFLYSEDELFNFWPHTVESDTFVITAWVAGGRANQLAKLSENEIVERAIECLARICNRDITQTKELILASYHHSWGSDPYFLGSYSYLRPNSLDGPKLLAKPLADKIYFAGEATAPLAELATVHGALNSAVRVSREILTQLELN